MVSSYKSLIASQDKEISQLKARIVELETQLSLQKQEHKPNGSLKSPVSIGNEPTVSLENPETAKEIAAMKHDIEFYKQECELMQRDLEDSLVCIAEQSLAVRKMKKRLKELGEPVEEDEDDEDEEQE